MATTITFEINPDTGEISADVDGVQGKGCEDLLAFLDELGENVETTRKPSYYEKQKVRAGRTRSRRKART